MNKDKQLDDLSKEIKKAGVNSFILAYVSDDDKYKLRFEEINIKDCMNILLWGVRKSIKSYLEDENIPENDKKVIQVMLDGIDEATKKASMSLSNLNNDKENNN